MNFTEFLNQNKGKDILIVTDNQDNVTKLIRKENVKGHIVSRVKVISLSDLCQRLINEYYLNCGKLEMIHKIDSEASCFVVGSILKGLKDCFVPKECFCDDLYAEVFDLMNQIRASKTTVDYENTDDVKMLQLKQVIAQYEEYLNQNNLFDNIQLMRMAIATNNKLNDLVGVVLFQQPTYLENQLLENTLTNFQMVDFASANQMIQYQFVECYGHSNEVNAVVETIKRENLPLGDVAILYSNVELEKTVHGILTAKGLKHNFTSAVSAESDGLVEILKLIVHWAKGNFQYEDLEKLFLNAHFKVVKKEEPKTEVKGLYDEFIKAIKANVCFGLERYDLLCDFNVSDDFKELVNGLTDIFARSETEVVADLLQNMVNFALTVMDENSTKVLGQLNASIQRFQMFQLEAPLLEALEMIETQLAKLTVTDGEESDAISCCLFGNAIKVLERKHIFMLGLNDKDFTKKMVESDILRDEELRRYLDVTSGKVTFAKQKEARHQKAIEDSLKTIDQATVSLSLSFMDPVDGSGLAPSVYYSSKKRLFGKSDNVTVVQCYPGLIDTDIINVIPMKSKEPFVPKKTNLTMSATRLGQLVQCPLEYKYLHFDYLNSIEYSNNDQSIWLEANERGTIVHRTLEIYVKSEFVGKAASAAINEMVLANAFETAVKEMAEIHPYSNVLVYKAEKKEMLKGIRDYLDQMHLEFFCNPNLKVVYTELDLIGEPACKITSPSGLTFQISGQIDRVDFDGQNYRIVDYKSGKYDTKLNEVKASKLEEKTLQHVLYTIGLKKLLNTNVQSFLYQFPFEVRSKKTLEVNVEEVSDLPEEVWERIEDVYLKGNFEVNKCNDKYCKFKKVCKFAFSASQEGEEE